MAVRSLDGVDDVISVTPPPYFTGAITVAAVHKRSQGDAWHAFFTLSSNLGNPDLVLEYGNSGELEFVAHGGGGNVHAFDTVAPWDGTEWRLAVVTWNGGNLLTDYRFHHFDGTTWTHVSAEGSSGILGTQAADWAAPGGPGGGAQLRFGNWDGSFNYFQGLFAVTALWEGQALNDAQVEALAGGSKEDWQAAGADHLWEFNQAATTTPVTDFLGDADQVALVGTAVVTDNDPPTSLYDFAGGGGGGAPEPDRFILVGGVWVPSARRINVGGAWV
jgi:hypothetical protein